ncbi:unnamed protein product [Hermetia illucens]|uniref:Uncharacterized protein n=1 Tax=Hermetia illucens TaxID=343691 RepID=A0A7R8UL94_HERIL|nr:uncharacterized protein LOC119648313 [Hermetia illucens]CAD7082703.1 unnamed protein product [Hermetia illucens]
MTSLKMIFFFLAFFILAEGAKYSYKQSKTRALLVPRGTTIKKFQQKPSNSFDGLSADRPPKISFDSKKSVKLFTPAINGALPEDLNRQKSVKQLFIPARN